MTKRKGAYEGFLPRILVGGVLASLVVLSIFFVGSHAQDALADKYKALCKDTSSPEFQKLNAIDKAGLKVKCGLLDFLTGGATSGLLT